MDVKFEIGKTYSRKSEADYSQMVEITVASRNGNKLRDTNGKLHTISQSGMFEFIWVKTAPPTAVSVVNEVGLDLSKPRIRTC